MPGLRTAAVTSVLALPLVLGPAASALAAQPDHWSFAVDDTFPSRTSEDCGFDILLHLEGTIRGVDFYAGDGTLQRSLTTYPGLTYTFINAVTGESVTSHSPDPEHWTWNPDGSATLHVTGLVLHWRVAGQGMTGQAGSFTVSIDAEGHDTMTESVGLNEDYHAALCEILAP
jgi:hypothetical protein